MKDFGEFNIKHDPKEFSGPKVGINTILNMNIIVEAYRVGPSLIKGKSDRLDMQILLKGEQRIVWVSSKNLIKMINQVPKENFPFTARIISIEGGGYKFVAAEKTT